MNVSSGNNKKTFTHIPQKQQETHTHTIYTGLKTRTNALPQSPQKHTQMLSLLVAESVEANSASSLLAQTRVSSSNRRLSKHEHGPLFAFWLV